MDIQTNKQTKKINTDAPLITGGMPSKAEQ